MKHCVPQFSRFSLIRIIAALLVGTGCVVADAQHHNHVVDSGRATPAVHDASSHHESADGMHGMYGRYYSSNREASGTSWQPESTPMDGIHESIADWSIMVHGQAQGIVTHEGGPRGADDAFSSNMFAALAQQDVDRATLGLRGMISLEPITIGKRGYPLLLQTGETADGITPLIDRQHPHDLFMEMAVAGSVAFENERSLFGYLGYPGEPALGPPVFMHRLCAQDNPQAPISHHWLDSTHITFGVLTLGSCFKTVKVEGSVFTGREPDQERFNFERPRFDSWSMRISCNPLRNWSLQVSYGHLKGSEQLEPGVNTNRTTASIMYNLPLHKGNWQTMLAWGRNHNHPGRTLDAWLLESAATVFKRHTFFGRCERVEKDELFLPGSRFEDCVFTVHKASIGYVFDAVTVEHLRCGAGANVSVSWVPRAIQSVYGGTPVSYQFFVRLKLV